MCSRFAASMASSGLPDGQCRTLKVLVLGERSRSDRNPAPARRGLIERAHAGEDVWADPRAQFLIDQLVNPTRRILNVWTDRQCVRGGVEHAVS